MSLYIKDLQLFVPERSLQRRDIARELDWVRTLNRFTKSNYERIMYDDYFKIQGDVGEWYFIINKAIYTELGIWVGGLVKLNDDIMRIMDNIIDMRNARYQFFMINSALPQKLVKLFEKYCHPLMIVDDATMNQFTKAPVNLERLGKSKIHNILIETLIDESSVRKPHDLVSMIEDEEFAGGNSQEVRQVPPEPEYYEQGGNIVFDPNAGQVVDVDPDEWEERTGTQNRVPHGIHIDVSNFVLNDEGRVFTEELERQVQNLRSATTIPANQSTSNDTPYDPGTLRNRFQALMED